MANTSGMSDEAMESMFTSSSPVAESSTTRKQAPAKKSLIRSRMETPIGARPAARVTIPTKGRRIPATTTTTHFDTDGIDDPNNDNSEDESKIRMPPEPVVGQIVERRNTKAKRGKLSAVVRPPRFTERMPLVGNGGGSNGGFPSVNVPLGTFVNKSSNNNDNELITKTNQQQLQSQAAIAVNNVTEKTHLGSRPSPTTIGKSNDNRKNFTAGNNEKFESLRKITSQDAQAMINEMSSLEIQQSIQELQHSLSPDLMEFLKNRRSKNTREAIVEKQNLPVNASENTACVTQYESKNLESHQHEKEENRRLVQRNICDDKTTISSSDVNDSAISIIIDHEDDDGRKEKERFANVLSSIKTYEDLDKAYRAEMERQGLSADEVDVINSSTIPTDHLDDDFAIACDLLRSTSKRQNLWAARIVWLKLQNDLDEEKCKYSLVSCKSTSRSNEQKCPYPILLPVSLRCVLDEPLSRTNMGVLHAYVLQSIYALLLIRAPRDHVVDVRCRTDGKLYGSESASVIYQHYYMDDAIPKPPLRDYYSGTTTLKPLNSTSDENGDASSSIGVYTTSSSTTSATSDGEAFFQDPMWTLLSKMKIIPRLAQMLQWSRRGSISQESFVPEESVVAICGILSMIGQRSPGAASAIVQHSTLLHDLCYFSLQQNQGSARYYPSRAIPFLVFMSTMARQSRVAAEALQRIDVDSIIMKALVVMSINEADYQLQKLALILWRILLRYGLSLSIIPTMLTLAAPHVALGKKLQLPENSEHQFSLSTEFFTCYNVILNCVRCLQLAVCQDVTKDNSNNGSPFLPAADQMDILSNACVWLSSSKRQAINHIMQTKFDWLTNADYLAHFSSILRYLDSLLKITVRATEDPGEFKAEEISLAEEKNCIRVLNSLIQSDAMKLVLDTVCFGASNVASDEKNSSLFAFDMFEATACACLESLLGLITSLVKKYCSDSSLDGGFQVVSNDLNELVDTINNLLGLYLGSAELVDQRGRNRWTCSLSGSSVLVLMDLPRRHWINSAHAALIVFLQENGNTVSKPMTKDIGCTLLGNLEVGEESAAAILLSFDDLLLDKSIEDVPSLMLSTVLLRELCRSPEERKQLDHSFRLRMGPGINASGLGPFKLDSLLSESDFGGSSSSTGDHFLPLGRFWPWKLLSGSVTDSESTEAMQSIYYETRLIVLATFQLIRDLEGRMDDGGYAKRLNTGGKLYYLVNTCLLPEQVLSNDEIHNQAEQLFEFYSSRLDSESIIAFTEECCKSVSKTPVPANEEVSSVNLSSRDEAKVKVMLDPESFADSSYSHHAVRSLLTFFGDLSEAFLDYGNVYPLFTKCIRLFLTKGFPTKVRCEVIRRLRDVLHLLTLDEDNDSVYLLKQFLLGGLPSVDNSSRDSPELLDSLALLFTKGNSVRRDAKLVIAFSVAALARSITINLKMIGTGLAVSKRRVMSLDNSMAGAVMETAFLFLATDGTLDSLISTTYQVCSPKHESCSKWFLGIVDDLAWQNAINVMREGRVD